MKKSNKVLFISLIPIALILVFVLYVYIPVDKEMKMQKEMLENKQQQVENAKSKLAKAEQEQKLAEEIIKMETQLGLFDINVPYKKDLDILLVDVEGFAKSAGVQILSLNAYQTKPVKIVDPEKEKAEAQKSKGLGKRSTKRSSKRRKNNAEENTMAISLNEIPLKIKVLGHYPKVIDFIQKLEDYRRIVSVDGVVAKDFSKDHQTKTPRVEIEISTKIYMQQENKTHEITQS